MDDQLFVVMVVDGGDDVGQWIGCCDQGQCLCMVFIIVYVVGDIDCYQQI